MNLTEQSASNLVSLYNDAAAELGRDPVKRFSDRKTAERRVAAIRDELAGYRASIKVVGEIEITPNPVVATVVIAASEVGMMKPTNILVASGAENYLDHPDARYAVKVEGRDESHLVRGAGPPTESAWPLTVVDLGNPGSSPLSGKVIQTTVNTVTLTVPPTADSTPLPAPAAKPERWRRPKRCEPGPVAYKPRAGSKQAVMYDLLTLAPRVSLERVCETMLAHGGSERSWVPEKVWGELSFVLATQKGYGLDFDGTTIQLLIPADERSMDKGPTPAQKAAAAAALGALVADTLRKA